VDERARLAHRNLLDFNRLSASLTPGGRIEEQDDEQLVSTPHQFPFVNMALREHDRPDADDLVARAKDFFGSGDGPGGTGGFTVCARAGGVDADLERAAKAAGLNLFLVRYPEMVCEHRVEIPALDQAAELREVTDTDGAAEYWWVCAQAYPSLGFPADLFDAFSTELLLCDEVRACVTYMGGEPAASALVALLDEVGFIGWVATAESARGRGLGEAVTAWVTNRALDAGARFTALQASPMGEPIYARMGYEEVFNYHLWLSLPE
jgi:GNAT superfamily N-acetyltransferase